MAAFPDAIACAFLNVLACASEMRGVAVFREVLARAISIVRAISIARKLHTRVTAASLNAFAAAFLNDLARVFPNDRVSWPQTRAAASFRDALARAISTVRACLNMRARTFSIV